MLHYLPVEGRHRRVTFFFALFACGHLRAMSVSNVTQRGRRYKTHIARTGCHHRCALTAGTPVQSALRRGIRRMRSHTGKTAPRRTERVRTVNILSARRCAHERFLRRAVRKGRGGESKGAEGRLRRGRISFDKITQYTLKPLTARTAFNIIILTTRV